MDLKEITPEEDVDDDADMPAEALRLGLRCVLTMTDVEGAIRNARLQRPTVTDEQLFAAFLYYLENDAFMLLTGE